MATRRIRRVVPGIYAIGQYTVLKGRAGWIVKGQHFATLRAAAEWCLQNADQSEDLSDQTPPSEH